MKVKVDITSRQTDDAGRGYAPSVAAVKDGRIVDAEYYRLVLKSMYPDWEYKGENNE